MRSPTLGLQLLFSLRTGRPVSWAHCRQQKHKCTHTPTLTHVNKRMYMRAYLISVQSDSEQLVKVSCYFSVFLVDSIQKLSKQSA